MKENNSFSAFFLFFLEKKSSFEGCNKAALEYIVI